MKKIIPIFLSFIVFAPLVNAQQSADAEVTALRMALEQALRENISLRADLEAARAEIDRIRGGASRPLSMMMPVPVAAVAVHTHTVSAGETLGGIAARHYGSVSSYHRIYEANRNIIADPNVIHVGQVLRIP